MQNNQNRDDGPSEGSMSNQKTNEDFNKKQPDPNNQNEETFDNHSEMLNTGGQENGVQENDDYEEGFCWLPTDPTNYMQARKINEQINGWVLISL